MSRTMEINGVTFELTAPRKPKHLEDVIRRLDRYAHRTIWECYERPSETKESIYKKWLDWYTDQGEEIDYFGVSSYNSMCFTLQALYFDGVFYYELRITRDYNRAILINAN